MYGWGTLLSSIVKLNPVDEVLMETTARNLRIDEIKVNICRRIGMFEQALCEIVASVLPYCFTGIFDWEIFLLPSILKHCKSLQIVLIGNAKLELIRLPEPTECRIEAGVLVRTNSLCNSLCGAYAGAYDKSLWVPHNYDYWDLGLENFHLRGICYLSI